MHGQQIDRFYAKPTDAREGSNSTLTLFLVTAMAGVCRASTTGNEKKHMKSLDKHTKGAKCGEREIMISMSTPQHTR